MRKLFRKQILLLTVLAVFFGCTANGGSKDIVKGLIDVATKSGVAPDVNALSTLILLGTIVLVVLTQSDLLKVKRKVKKRKKEEVL